MPKSVGSSVLYLRVLNCCRCIVSLGFCLLVAALLPSVVGTVSAQPSTDILEQQWIVGVEQGEQQVVFGSVGEIEYQPGHGLYVLDTGLQTVHLYDAEGRRIGGFEYRRGQGPGELQQPMDLAVDGDGGTFIVDRGLRRVVQFTSEGEFVQQHPVPFQPTRVASVGGRIFLTPFWLTSDSTLYVSEPDGTNRRGLLPRPETWKTTAMTGNFERLEVTSNGTLLRSLPYPYQLSEVDVSGAPIREASGHPTFAPPQQSGTVSQLQEGARGLALLETGQVVHLILDQAESRVYLDLFSRDLTFQKRIEITDVFPSTPLPSLEAGPGTTLYFAFRDPYAQIAAYTLKL